MCSSRVKAAHAVAGGELGECWGIGGAAQRGAGTPRRQVTAGRPVERELGDGWTAGVHPDDYDYCMHLYRGAFTAREPFQMEYRLRREDGDYRWILDHVVPRDRGGRDSFENLVWSKKEINSAKANRLPHEAGLRLIRRPKAPAPLPAAAAISEPKHPDWRHFLSA